MRKIVLTPTAFDDLKKLLEEEGFEIFNKFHLIVRNIQQDLFRGLGKPEPLKGNLSGYWSRRITYEHRLVYRITNESIEIIQCYGHY